MRAKTSNCSFFFLDVLSLRLRDYRDLLSRLANPIPTPVLYLINKLITQVVGVADPDQSLASLYVCLFFLHSLAACSQGPGPKPH